MDAMLRKFQLYRQALQNFLTRPVVGLLPLASAGPSLRLKA